MLSDKNISLVMKRNHKYLVDNLKNLNLLTKTLYEKKLISYENFQNFKDEYEGKGRNRRLSFLLSSAINTQGCFKTFLQTLQDTDNADIAYRLAPNENLQDFDQLDNNQDNIDAIDYDVSQVNIKPLNKNELDNIVHNSRNYPMSLQQRSKNRLGRVLIINNNKFVCNSNRDGSEKDVELLKVVFEKLHFIVQTANDLTAEELRSLLQKECECFNRFNHKGSQTEIQGKEERENEFDGRRHEQTHTNGNIQKDNNGDTVERFNPNNTRQKFTKDNKKINEKEPREDDYKDVCVFILLVMSHGGKGHVYGTDGTSNMNNVSIEEIMNTFNGQECPGLNNIPKLVFIQACQEDDVSSVKPTYWKNVKRKNQSTTHKMADSFLMLSTVQGEKALRNIKKGTYFIHILCKTIATKCHYWGLSDIVTEINALHRSMIIKCTNGILLQQPETNSKLSRPFFFLP